MTIIGNMAVTILDNPASHALGSHRGDPHPPSSERAVELLMRRPIGATLMMINEWI